MSAAALDNPAPVATDAEDYTPSCVMHFDGTGFLPSETVSNQVVQVAGPAAGTASKLLSIVADTNGSFSTFWLVCTGELLGAPLELTTRGQTLW